MEDLAVYAALFMSAFFAATLLPVASEGALAALLLTGYSPLILLTVASIGNVAGSAVNWWLGREVNVFRDCRWFPLKGPGLDRASSWYRRYGRWSLLASWVPIIGDPLTIVAGVLREPFWNFLALVAVAKTGRYLVLAWMVLHWAPP